MIKILDSTLREGLQSVDPYDYRRGIVFSEGQSIKIAQKLIDLGIDYIELGSPVESPLSSALIKKIIKMSTNTRTSVTVHCRCLKDDVDLALATGAENLNLYFNFTDESKRYNSKSIDQVLNVLKYAKSRNPKVILRYSFEDTFRTSYKRIQSFTNLIAPYIQRVGFPDTTGRTTPQKVEKLLRRFKSDFPMLETEVHFHNDLLLASANAYTACLAGVTIVDTTVLGIGERNGIVPLSGLFATLLSDSNFNNVPEKYNLKLLPDLDKYLAKILSIPIPLCMPISSTGYFCNTAGVHVNGFLENKKIYQNIVPEYFGLEYKYSWASAVIGKSNIKLRAKQLKISLNDTTAQKLAAELRETAKNKGKLLPRTVDIKIKKHGKK